MRAETLRWKMPLRATKLIEGVEFTPAMRALLERAIRENMSDEEFTKAVIEVTRG